MAHNNSNTDTESEPIEVQNLGEEIEVLPPIDENGDEIPPYEEIDD